MVRLFIMGLTILCVNLALARNICDVSDQECTKSGAKAAYRLFVDGIDSIVETSDPMTMAFVKANLPTVRYELRNIIVTGLKTCDVILMRVNKGKLSFDFHLRCPKMEVNSDYTLIGEVNNMHVEGEGKFTVKLNDYIMKFNGIYEKVTGTDDKEHIHIKNYILEVDNSGGVLFDFQNLYDGDKEKGDAFNAYLNKHWQEMDKALRAPTLYAVMDVFIKNLNDFLSVIPAEEIFPETA